MNRVAQYKISIDPLYFGAVDQRMFFKPVSEVVVHLKTHLDLGFRQFEILGRTNRHIASGFVLIRVARFPSQ